MVTHLRLDWTDYKFEEEGRLKGGEGRIEELTEIGSGRRSLITPVDDTA